MQVDAILQISRSSEIKGTIAVRCSETDVVGENYADSFKQIILAALLVLGFN